MKFQILILCVFVCGVTSSKLSSKIVRASVAETLLQARELSVHFSNNVYVFDTSCSFSKAITSFYKNFRYLVSDSGLLGIISQPFQLNIKSSNTYIQFSPVFLYKDSVGVYINSSIPYIVLRNSYRDGYEENSC